MHRFARALMIVLVTVIAAAPVLHAAGASAMSVRMALADGGMNMPGCDDCGMDQDDGSKARCELVCVTNLVATVDAGIVLPPPAAAENAAPIARRYPGWTVPPEPYPPQSPI